MRSWCSIPITSIKRRETKKPKMPHSKTKQQPTREVFLNSKLSVFRKIFETSFGTWGLLIRASSTQFTGVISGCWIFMYHPLRRYYFYSTENFPYQQMLIILNKVKGYGLFTLDAFKFKASVNNLSVFYFLLKTINGPLWSDSEIMKQ